MKRLFLASALFSIAPIAYACSCVSGTPDTYTKQADIVFRGVVEDRTQNQEIYEYAVLFEVTDTYKGKLPDDMTVFTPLDSAGCGVNFEIGEEYVVFAVRQEEGQYWTGLCSGTTNVENADEILSYLNTYQNDEQNQCAPYVCEDGTEHPACTEDGNVINYFVDPCFKDHQQPFTDVPRNHINVKAIEFVKEQGIVSGYPDGTFRPNQTINRAEFTKIVLLTMFSQKEINKCNPANLRFSDVSLLDWFVLYVCVAKAEDIIAGYPDGTFKPGQTINFAEAAKIIVLTFEISTEKSDYSGIWWKPFIYALGREGALPSSLTDPNQMLTRGEMAEIVYRLLK